MSEMIERVAFALEKVQMDAGDYAGVSYVDLAKAAIGAMREATYQMLLEGQSVVNLTDTPGHFEYISRDEAQEIWETMVEEAMK